MSPKEPSMFDRTPSTMHETVHLGSGDSTVTPSYVPTPDPSEYRTADCNDDTFLFKPMAICGMACRLPGRVHSPQELWEFLLSKGDPRSRVPETRYGISGYFSKSKKPGTTNTEYGYFLDESVALGALDTSFFPMARKELENLDPQQRILLEISRECVDDAGEVGWKGKNVGVYIGSFGNDWYDTVEADAQKSGIYQLSTRHDFALSNRISYEMDLQGPSMTIRTACSSSLIALNEACSSIARGECSSAIVGGVNIIMAPSLTTDISQHGALSPDGSCKTFSSVANGYARGEGVVAFYVKSLHDALRDGNPIRSVVVGAGANSDGKTPGFSVPSSAAQEALIRNTYKLSGISREELLKTGYFECHGTGTPVGDPIEAKAVAKVFEGSGGLYIGSIKPNLGHSEGASGLVALMKVVLALEHRVIPPTIKSLPLNPKIPFHEGGLTIATEATPWPEGRYERASVNAFGIGGANAHVIVDSAARFGIHQAVTSNGEEANAPQLLVYSANTPQSLKEMIKKWALFLETTPPHLPLADISYTLANRREHLPFRSFTVGTRHVPGIAAPPTSLGSVSRLVMVFTGQGSQWPQMGRELLLSNQIFQATIRLLDQFLKGLGPHTPGWTIEDELLKPPRVSRVNKVEFSQPLCTAIQIALVDILVAIGLKPEAVVGHSSGEIAAAYASGGLTAKEAIIVAFLRGLICSRSKRRGGMAAVGLSWQDVEQYLVPGVVVACENSPSSVTLSGDVDQLKLVVTAIKKNVPGVLASTLKVDAAYHSHHMAELGEDYHHAMVDAGIKSSKPAVPFFSSVTGKAMASEDLNDIVLGPSYWKRNLESPVLFSTAVSSILQHQSAKFDNPVFLEVGPHAALSGPLRQILAKQSSKALHIGTLMRQQNSSRSFLTAVGKLWALHLSVNFAVLIPKGQCLPDLPRYPWNHQQVYWNESRVSKEWRYRKHQYHDLLGVKVPESSQIEPIWRNMLHVENVPWVRDHRIREDVIFPFAGYIAMAAEAVRQITGVEEAVELRHVTVTTGLVLNERAPAEILTSCRRHRLTDATDSQWWEFTITSYNGHSWTKHCFGQVRASSIGLGNKTDTTKATSLPNKVHMHRWYERVKRAGLDYGDHFRTVKEMSTTSTGSRGMCNGKLRNWPGDEASYHVHPTVMDTCFQLLGAAGNHGTTHAYRQFIPLSVDYMAFSRCSDDDIDMNATCETSGDGIVGEVVSVTKSGAFANISGAHLTPLDRSDDKDGNIDVPITARFEWVPHVDFSDMTALVEPVQDHTGYMPMLESLAQSAAMLSKRTLMAMEGSNPMPHVQKYKDWLLQKTDASLEEMDTSALTCSIDSLAARLEKTPAAQAAMAILKICNNTASILSGQNTGLRILDTDELLPKLHRFIGEYDASSFLRCLAQSKPNLRILELGAGLGPMSNSTWDDLRRPDGQVMYSKYVYVEAIPALTTAAKERFGKVVSNLEFATLDIRNDPDQQRFEDRDFDLLIANGVIHMTASIRTCLGHVRKLLRPGGRLLMQQPREGLTWTKYVLGTLPEWWCGVNDGRPDEPYIPSSVWLSELEAASFHDVCDVVDLPQPFHLSSVVIAKSCRETRPPPKRVTILHQVGETAGVNILAAHLEAKGFQTTNCTLEDALPETAQDVISLLDFTAPFLENIDSDSFENLKILLQKLASSGSGLFWLTRPSQAHNPDPRYAPIIGFARTVRSEIGIDFATCETDELCSPGSTLKHASNVFISFHEREADGVLELDFEYLITAGITYVSRFFPISLEEEKTSQKNHEEGTLNIGTPGRLDSLYWAAMTGRAPEGDEVEVEVYAAGLNFRDVLTAVGVVELRSRNPTLGCEAAGVIRRVGPNAKKFRVGDRVLLLGMRTFSTVLTLSELLCEKLPSDISFTEGASMPVVFATAIQSLINVAHLEKDQSVLIHSGCGGVGLAAIQIARMIGAQVFTTVGNEDKVRYLMENFGIPRNHIFDSRSTSFAADLMRETDGRGVDVALNSLSGELLHATWRCIAKFGMMVEIGKRDLFEGAKLDMGAFLANRSYCCVDLYQLCQERPRTINRILKSMMEYYREGFIKPVVLAQVYPPSTIVDAMRYMQQGSHIGKIAISIRNESTRNLEVEKITPVYTDSDMFDPGASYLLVGGLGGLGHSVSVWMAQRGARHLTFMSRHAGDGAADVDLARRLESMGCSVQLVRGSVTNVKDVANAIRGTPKPLKGVLQMSMVLRDQALSRMTMDEWNEATSPKIQGTWNLHNVLQAQGVDLDFFVLFSSLSGIIGQVGQANYAAANTFLDAFVRYRTNLGLRCAAIDVGAMEGVGYLSENEDLLKKMQGMGWRSVTEEEFLEALDATIRNFSTSNEGTASQPSSPRTETLSHKGNMLLGVVPAASPGDTNSSARLRKDIRMAIYHNTNQHSSGEGDRDDGGDDTLRAFLTAAKRDPASFRQPEAAKALAREIGKKLFALLLKPEQEPDISRELAELGLDSMIAVEMRAWWKLELGLTISVLEMLAMGTLLALGEKAAKELADKYEG
ncbi:hypothetical protein F5Y10DRAFT_265029 [Nemania abortiva]|nr:hypothetical protein F5Y10DRAFT_265029 [Nemania abortiva]